MMLMFLPLCSGVLLWFHSFSGDIVRAGAGWALSLGLWGPGASLSAERAGPRAALLAESCHTTQPLPHLCPPGTGCSGAPAGLTSSLGAWAVPRAQCWGSWLQFPFPGLAATAGCSILGGSECVTAVESSKAEEPKRNLLLLLSFVLLLEEKMKGCVNLHRLKWRSFRELSARASAQFFSLAAEFLYLTDFSFSHGVNSFSRFCCFNAAQWIIFLGSHMKDD